MRYWNESNTPVYPFGYGLSYTAFSYENLRLSSNLIAPGETLTASIDVTNTGTISADEVVQLYIHQRFGTSARPVRELKGFRRITLTPGETRTISFQLGPDELKYWSSVTRDWVQDETIFDIGIGKDSGEVELNQHF